MSWYIHLYQIAWTLSVVAVIYYMGWWWGMVYFATIALVSIIINT